MNLVGGGASPSPDRPVPPAAGPPWRGEGSRRPPAPAALDRAPSTAARNPRPLLDMSAHGRANDIVRAPLDLTAARDRAMDAGSQAALRLTREPGVQRFEALRRAEQERGSVASASQGEGELRAQPLEPSTLQLVERPLFGGGQQR